MARQSPAGVEVSRLSEAVWVSRKDSSPVGALVGSSRPGSSPNPVFLPSWLWSWRLICSDGTVLSWSEHFVIIN